MYSAQTAVTVSTSDDVNRHSTAFKMATVLEEWTMEERRCVVRIFSA
jgi:hypothetical protein